MPIHKTVQRLQYLLEVIPSKFVSLTGHELSFKRDANTWSKKEVLGHLIDSAANNHHRFIRTQFDDVPVIFYNQNQWVALNFYNELGTEHIVNLWTIYNRHLLEVIKRIPEENLQREANSGGDKNHTLQWLIDDYVAHMEHHLRQIVEYI